MKNLMTLATVSLVLLGAVAGASAAQFTLSGLVARDNGDGMAWLQEPSLTQNKVVIVHRGDRVGPWKVTRILEDRVELEGPAGKLLVSLGTTLGSGTPSPARTIPAGDPARQAKREALSSFSRMLQDLGKAQPQTTARAKMPKPEAIGQLLGAQ